MALSTRACSSSSRRSGEACRTAAGRRSILLLTLTGTALSYVVWFFAGSFALLIAARLAGGIMAGNISIASAAVADTHKKADRAKGMGILGAGIGLGFVVGPALGGLASGWDLTASLPDTPGINPFSGAALIAFVLALINLIWAAARFPETLEATTDTVEKRSINPFAAQGGLTFPGVRTLNFAYFIYFAAFGAMEFTLVFLRSLRSLPLTHSPVYARTEELETNVTHQRAYLRGEKR